jgi:mannose-6-phosphate isomerase-like protein (cupin superfamily)
MADYTAKKIGDIEAIYGGGFKLARADLGVESFGMQILEMPPGYADYPEHDHAETGQEEVYLVLSGSAELKVDGESVQLDPDTIVRVGPGTKRKIVPGDEGVRFLALGGTPGAVYEAAEGTQLGTPDPMAQASG